MIMKYPSLDVRLSSSIVQELVQRHIDPETGTRSRSDGREAARDVSRIWGSRAAAASGGARMVRFCDSQAW